ncbi:MAG: hypothetical protein GXP32_04320, partial [Kiritimatiellaeota bacterium]|nr:hypothetical protein [Kiritimatiellota bacterium]
MDKRVEWRLSVLIFLIALIAYGYFFNCGGWSQNARYDSIFAFVEPGTSDYQTFHIDRFVANPNKGLSNTGDWSYYAGHFYSNKAPGATFLGIPVYAAIFQIERAFSIPWNHPYIEILNAYLINFFLTVLPAALAVVFFFKFLLVRGASTRRAAVFALVFALCTPMLPYSTSLWGHITAMSFIVFAMYAGERGGKWLFLAGFLAGIATLTDYLALIPTACFGALVLWRERTRVWRFIIGGV